MGHGVLDHQERSDDVELQFLADALALAGEQRRNHASPNRGDCDAQTVPEVGGGIQRSDDVVRVEGITGTYVDLGGIAQMLDDL